MEKVYLLLRNNIESGPFTLNELFQQQLQPNDMVWVEGRSTAWSYLSEMELHFHAEETNKSNTSIKKIRQVGDEIEQKAEEIRKRALSYKPKPLIIQKDFAPAMNNDNRGYVIPEDAIEIVDHRKEKSKTVNEVVMSSLIIGLFAMGLYFGSQYVQTRKEIISPAATRVTPPEKKIISRPGNQPANIITVADTKEKTDSLQHQVASFSKENKTAFTNTKQKDTSLQKPIPAKPLLFNVEETNLSTTVKVPLPEVEKKDEPVKDEISSKDKKALVSTEKKPEAKKDQQAKEEDDKKKGFLKNLFRKKNKDDKEKKNKKDN